MKADLELYYTCDYSPEVKVIVNSESISINIKEVEDTNFRRICLSTDDAKEIIAMLSVAVQYKKD